MSETTLAHVMQASDLHVGDTVRGGLTPALLGASSHFEGWLDHHFLGARQLHQAFVALRRRDHGALLAISGDLTSNGAVAQFDLARGFLEQTGSNSPFGFGLGERRWADLAIPGNHDRWPGSNIVLGPPTTGFAACFPHPFPIVRPPVALAGGATLRFVLVDGDADVGWASLDRGLGRGSFLTQLRALDASLPAIEGQEIRVMLLHHAICDGRTPTGNGPVPFPTRPGLALPRSLEIDAASLSALQLALVRHSIRIVLTGHLHWPRLSILTVTDGTNRREVLEARCGTTMQQDQFPPHLVPHLPPGRSLPPNTLVLHELLRRDGDLVWRATVHRRTAASGFVPTPLVRELPL